MTSNTAVPASMTFRLAVIVTACLLLTALAGCQIFRSPQAAETEAIDHYVQGRLLLDSGDTDAALLELVLAVEADPTLASAHAAIGDIYRQRNDPEMAVYAYERAVEANPYNTRNLYNCGLLHQTLAAMAESAEEATRRLKRAAELYLRTIVMDDSDYDAHLNLAVCYYELGDMIQAEMYCRRAIEIDPDQPDAHTNLGAVCHRQGRYYDAIANYNESIERQGRQPEVLMNLGEVYLLQGKHTMALRSYEMARDLEPGSAKPLERMAHCHFFLKDYEQAIRDYQAAIALDRRCAEAFRGLGVVYMAQYLQDRRREDLREQAVEQWRRSLAVEPDQPDLARLLEKYDPQGRQPQAM